MENENNKLIYIDIKELLIGREVIFKERVKQVQDGIISFCRNINLFQDKPNFFDLNITEQFKFNECIDTVSNKMKQDYKDIETFYVKCKTMCGKRFEFVDDNVDEYIAGARIGKNLHPCTRDCVELFDILYNNYHDYMIKGNR